MGYRGAMTAERPIQARSRSARHGVAARHRWLAAALALLLACAAPSLVLAQDEEGDAPAEAGQEDRAPLEEAVEEPPDRFDVVGDALVATADGGVAWRRPLPPAGGPTADPRLVGDTLWLPRGLYLLALDPRSGEVRARVPLPAPAVEVREGDGPDVRVEHEDGRQETVRIRDGEPEGPVRFGARAEAFGWLRAEAEALGDEAAQLDPTNPWAHLAGAQTDADEDAVGAAIEAARPLPFFEKARLALALDVAARHEAAADLMNAALRDMAERGYDPRLLTSAELRDAYGMPLSIVRSALARDDVDTAERWAPWLWRTAAPSQPASLSALHDLADALEARGEPDAAELWRERAASLDAGGLGRTMDRAALSLARFGWAAVGAVLVAVLLLYLTLWAKYARPQSFHRRQQRERGEVTPPATRLLAIRHFSTTEKLVLVLLLVSAAVLAGLTGWGRQASERPDAFGSGTLASTPAWGALQQLPDNADAAFARGYAAYVRGDAEEARRWLDAAGEHAGALNNLGVVTGDEALYQHALRVSPRHPEARFNLGRRGSPSPFHEAYRTGEPLLAAPTPTDLALASGGDWRTTAGDVLARPWSALPAARPAGVPSWAWWAVLVVYAALLVAAVAMLFRPRPRVSRNAPRTWAYHVLAVLIPGTGQADEVYGVLLILPWSILGLDVLVRAAWGASPLGIGLGLQIAALVVLYLINVGTYAVELLSYRRRMRLLREEQPELARSLGLPPLPRRRSAPEA